MRFSPSTRLTAGDDQPVHFAAAFSSAGNFFAVRELPGGGYALPDAASFPIGENALWCGDLDGKHVLALELASGDALPENTVRKPLREASLLLNAEEYTALQRAVELTHWRKRAVYCGHCGAALTDTPEECARLCPECHALYFPVIAPAVIVLVTRGKDILLAHNNRFKPGRFGLIAGFVESGETAEEAVSREVAEEVGIRVKQIRYWGSQCWPFPNSLMLGFRAEYAAGEVSPDGSEIGEAGFFPPGNWPDTPAPGSIAHRMIEEYRNELLQGGEKNE